MIKTLKPTLSAKIKLIGGFSLALCLAGSLAPVHAIGDPLKESQFVREPGQSDAARLEASEAAILERLRRSESGGAVAEAPPAASADDSPGNIVQAETVEPSEDAKVVSEAFSALITGLANDNSANNNRPNEETKAPTLSIPDDSGSKKTEPSRTTQPKVIHTGISKNTHNKVKSQLAEEKRKNAKLQRELLATRDRLLMAETEVERLSSVINSMNSLKHPQSRTSAPAPRITSRTARSPQVSSRSVFSKTRAQTNAPAEDLPVLTVTAKKANLRTGPGLNNSPLMTVAKGTRLVVETRKGEWYRILAPTGVRAWISKSVVAFGPDKNSRPSRVMEIRGYEQDADTETAVKAIRSQLDN